MAKKAEDQNVMKEKVDEYKRAHPEKLPDFDFALLLKSLEKMNGSSAVKIAKNAYNEKREWIPGTYTSNAGKVFLSDDHCVVFTLRAEGAPMTVDKLLDDLEPIKKKLPLKSVPVMLQLGEDKRVQLTDLYAHSLVTEQWAGLPVDFVLIYTQAEKKVKIEEAAE